MISYTFYKNFTSVPLQFCTQDASDDLTAATECVTQRKVATSYLLRHTFTDEKQTVWEQMEHIWPYAEEKLISYLMSRIKHNIEVSIKDCQHNGNKS